MSKKFPNGVDVATLSALLAFSDRYQITIQFWPKSTAVFIAKDYVDLCAFGGDANDAIGKALEYLQRVNSNNKKTSHDNS